jgi:Tol biopolymer transport system component
MEDNRDIYVHQIGSTGTPLRLTHSPDSEATPTWSPNDRWIAFSRYDPSKPFPRTFSIVVISPLGGPEREIAEARFGDFTTVAGPPGLCWTRDGTWLVFGDLDTEQRGSSLWAAHVETGVKRRLTTFSTRVHGAQDSLGDTFPSISPDGRTLAFARRVTAWVSELYKLPLAGNAEPASEPIRITDRRYPQITGTSWTADGRQVVYAAGALWGSTLWRVAASGTRAPEPLPYATPDAYFPAVSWTSSRLAYTWRFLNVSLWRLDVVNGERKVLVRATYSSNRPHYSPDGRKIAFQSIRSGHNEVWTCDADGSNCQQLTFFNGPQGGSPRWSPDGRWIALDAAVEGWFDAYVVKADGGMLTRVTNGAGVSSNRPFWSHDGQFLYVDSDRTGSREIWKVPRVGGDAIQVTRAGGANAQASPDGKYIYYTKEPGLPGLFRTDLSTGEETTIVPRRLRGSGGFAVTRKGVYFVEAGPAPNVLQFIDSTTGELRTIGPLGTMFISNFTVSADDRYVLWSQSERETIDLMLVNNFR